MSRHRVFLGQISDCLNPNRDRIVFPLTPGVHAEATQIGLCLDHLILQGRLLYQTAQEFLLSYDDAIIRFAGQQGLGHMAFLQPIDLWCLPFEYQCQLLGACAKYRAWGEPYFRHPWLCFE